MSPISSLLFFFFLLTSTISSSATTKTLPISSAPPATIPAFPEQSNVAGCPLDLPDQLFHNIHSACGGELRHSRCCPVLAAWLYSAYSSTALGRSGAGIPAGHSPSYDMPLMPDDSEACINDLGKAMRQRGVELPRPNETCDVVYCYCGIRLHPLSCPDAFGFDEKGKLVGDGRVERLERDCLSSSKNVDGFPGLGGCNKCLNTLNLLTRKNALNGSKTEDKRRSAKMRSRDCQLMALTWLLSKDRPAYIRTVSAVLRALMSTPAPKSCTLGTDGMPLAVDSAQISGQSSSTPLQVHPSSSIRHLLPVLSLIIVPGLILT